VLVARLRTRANFVEAPPEVSGRRVLRFATLVPSVAELLADLSAAPLALDLTTVNLLPNA